MLKLWKFGARDATNRAAYSSEFFIDAMSEARDVTVTQQINGDYTLDFSYPVNGRCAKPLYEGVNGLLCIAECEGQFFVITRVSHSENVIRASCTHVWNFSAKTSFLPNFASTDSGDFIGEELGEIVPRLNNKLDSNVLSAIVDETMKDVRIDLESMDKTNAYDVMQKIIECAGFGEMLIDNGSCILTERIGSDTDVVLHTGLNMGSVTVERDMTETATRLYVYGKDGMSISSVTDDRVEYITKQENLIGGHIDAYKEYPDIDDPNKLCTRAKWEFDEDNPNRINVPTVNISGNVVDLSKASTNWQRLKLGDTVTVFDNGMTLRERVTAITVHPYEPELDSVSIGRVKKDMFFYLNQIGEIAKKYNKLRR